MTDKLCKDCKHLEGYGVVCKSPRNGVCLVQGTKVVWAKFCRDSAGLCGVEAKWFEPIETAQPRTADLLQFIKRLFR